MSVLKKTDKNTLLYPIKKGKNGSKKKKHFYFF